MSSLALLAPYVGVNAFKILTLLKLFATEKNALFMAGQSKAQNCKCVVKGALPKQSLGLVFVRGFMLD